MVMNYFYIKIIQLEEDRDPYNRPMMPDGFSELHKEDKLIAKHKIVFQKMSALRKTSDAAIYGKLQTRYVSDEVFCFERMLDNEALLICLNKGAETFNLDQIPISFPRW